MKEKKKQGGKERKEEGGEEGRREREEVGRERKCSEPASQSIIGITELTSRKALSKDLGPRGHLGV